MRNQLPQVCSDSCTYRSLYEGTQTSLSDMAAKQASALGRVGHVRSGIIMAIKRSFPKQFAEAEQSSGKRFADFDDEVLLTYMNAFLIQATIFSTTKGNMDSLLVELKTAGYDTTGAQGINDVINILKNKNNKTSSYELENLFEEENLVQKNNSGKANNVITEDLKVPMQKDHLQDDAELSRNTAASLKNTPSKSTRYRKTDLSLQKESRSLVKKPEEANTHELQNKNLPYTPQYEIPDTSPDVNRVKNSTQQDNDALAQTEYAVLNSEEGVTNDAKDSLVVKDAAVKDVSDLFMFDEEESLLLEDILPLSEISIAANNSVANNDTGSSPTKRKLIRKDTSVLPPVSNYDLHTPDKYDTESLEDLFADTDMQNDEQSTTLKKAETSKQIGTPLRPQMLFPEMKAAKSTKRVVKSIRTAATPPDSRVYDVPSEMPENTAELNDEVRKALLAAICLPRPVFSADLVAVAGSMELVNAWESEIRGPEVNNVRFIPPKTRHKALGTLFLPTGYLRTAATEFKKTAWAECMTRYRGAKAYELGVLLRRVGEDVVAYNCGDDTMTLSLVQPKGAVGIVASSGTDFSEGSSVTKELLANVEEMLSMRLVHLAILSTNASAGVVESLINVIAEEGNKRKWDPLMPVIVGKSWEYADSQGSAAQLVLGG